MFAMILSALLVAPADCPVPESMPPLSEAMAGEGDADWCLDAADPFAIAGPDGPPRQMVAIDADSGIAQVVQWRRGGPGPVPAGWRRVVTRAAKPGLRPGQFYEVLFQKLGDNVIVVSANPAWRIGNAVCVSEGSEAVAYLPAGVTPSENDRAVVTAMSQPDDIDPGNVMCTLLHRDGDGWRVSFRGPQGRPLPEIDDYYSRTLTRVTPPGDYERILGIRR